MKMKEILKKKMSKTLCAVLTAIVAMSGLLALDAGAQEETIAAYTQEMTEFINAQMSQHDIKGLSIAVVYGDQAVFVKGFGEADQGVPVDANTTFRLGSVAKVFTGMAAMQLAEQGLIDLDAPLTDYLPEFSVRYHVPATTPITIRHLMTHQSGLPGGKLKDAYSPTPVDFREQLAYAKDQYAAYPPEYMTSYSNLAVTLLGIVIERVSGQPFESYMQERMFAPLTMSSSHLGYPADGSAIARPYGVSFDKMNEKSGNTYHDVPYLRNTGAGDIWSSAADMSLFLRMLLAGGYLGDREIIAEDTLKRMFEVQNSQLPLDFASSGGQRWGLSWLLYPLQDPGGMMIGHGGTTGFYHAFLNFVPAYDVGVLVCSNTAHAFSTVPSIGLHGLETAVAMFHGENFAFAPPGEIPPVAPSWTEEQRQQVAGAFATSVGLVRIDDTPTGLALSVFDTQVPLVPHEDGWLSLGEPGMCPQGICRIRVQRINDERTLAFEYQGGGRETVGVEYALPQNVAPEWQRRVGTYRLLNPEDCYYLDSSARIYIALDQDTGVLERHIINLSDNNHSLLAPMAEDMALRLARGRDMNETYSFYEVDGRIEYEASGTRFRKTDLQDTLDEMAADGDSEIDAASGMLADDRDSRWMLASGGQHDVMLLFDSYGLIGDYEFGIYQGDTYVPFAALNSSEKRQTLFDILADGSVTIGGEDSGVDMSGAHFGFYLSLKGQPKIHSDSLLNAEGKDHMRAYQGNGERIDMSSILGSDMSPITWGTDQYLLAWDIGIGDDEYADVLILVDAIETPTEETDNSNCFINSIGF